MYKKMFRGKGLSERRKLLSSELCLYITQAIYPKKPPRAGAAFLLFYLGGLRWLKYFLIKNQVVLKLIVILR